MILALFAQPSFAHPGFARAEESWAELFAGVARLESMDASSPAFDKLAATLYASATARERAGRKAKDPLERYRGRVVQYHVQLLRHLPAGDVPDPDLEPAWLPHEAWLATRALEPGPLRVQAAIVAMSESQSGTPGGTPDDAARRASWTARLADDERARGRLDLAERAAAAVHAHAPGENSALALACIYARRGRTDDARAVLTTALHAESRAEARARLLCSRARVSAGARDDRGALADWGAALSLGSDEAALDLAWRALGEGERQRARVLAGALLAESPGQDDALSAWGRALLPAPRRAAPTLAGTSGKVP